MSESPQSFGSEWRNSVTMQLWDWTQLTVARWRERSQLRRELNDLNQRGELRRTLQDAGLTSSDVNRLMRAHPRTPQQLAEMMRHLGIDRSATGGAEGIACDSSAGASSSETSGAYLMSRPISQRERFSS